jgi:hypothetical protein
MLREEKEMSQGKKWHEKEVPRKRDCKRSRGQEKVMSRARDGRDRYSWKRDAKNN